MHTEQKKSTLASVAVVLTTQENGVLLQLRDDVAGIEYPGHWALIAGWIEAGESPTLALQRELHEELEAVDEHRLLFGPVTFLGCRDRSDRPWAEYVFHARVLTPLRSLRINEGQAFDVFTFEQCARLERLAPHHRQHIERYRHQIESELSSGFIKTDNEEDKEKSEMRTIEEHIEVSELGHVKDYQALEVGDGFVVSTTKAPTAAIHPKADARFIALLEFVHDVPRGNHYHLRKVEYMIVLRGRLHCSFAFPADPKKTFDVTLEAGQMVRILPGCVQTFTAKDGDVLALEYSPQKYEASDVFMIE